jgi:hypothetical protein
MYYTAEDVSQAYPEYAKEVGVTPEYHSDFR